MEEKPKVTYANIIAGDILYWVCIVSAIVSMIGSVISLLIPGNNIADPYRVFDLVWKGKDSTEIWAALTEEGKYPGVHFWMKHPSKGDGIAQLGIWLGCASALPAAFIAGFVYLYTKQRVYFVITMWVSFMILFAMLGIVNIKS